MKKPAVYTPDQHGRTLVYIWDTPVVVVGHTWLPLVQALSWPIFSHWSGQRNPQRGPVSALALGAVHTLTVLGSEWCHNLAHVAAARQVDRPMDALRIAWGMPLCVYYELEDQLVSPRQHIARALGGPCFNLAAAVTLALARIFTRPRTPGREIADVALGANVLILCVGLLPYPGIDGGPILKWSLVDRGRTTQQADRIVRGVDAVVATGLAAAAVQAGKRRRQLLSALLGLLSALGFSLALGFLRES